MPSTPEPTSLPAEIAPDASRDDAVLHEREKQPPTWLAKNLRWLGTLCIANVVLLVVLIGGPALRQYYVLETLRSSDVEFSTHEIGPKWLRKWIGVERMEAFETIYIIVITDVSIPLIVENP